MLLKKYLKKSVAEIIKIIFISYNQMVFIYFSGGCYEVADDNFENFFQ